MKLSHVQRYEFDFRSLVPIGLTIWDMNGCTTAAKAFWAPYQAPVKENSNLPL
jgi:hypothetical protein